MRLPRVFPDPRQFFVRQKNAPFPAAGHQTVSIGVTQAIPGENLDALLVRVDKALYQAKKTGKNRYVIL